MKNSIFRARLLFIPVLLFLTGFTLIHTVYAVTPTPTLTDAQVANRLARAKNVCLAQILTRENAIKASQKLLNTRKTMIFDADYTQLTTMLTNLETQLTAWRAAINAATTVDDVKSIQIANIQSIRSNVIMRNYTWLFRIDVVNRTYAQYQAHATGLQTVLSGKNTSDKKGAYVHATAHLKQLNTALAGVSASVTNEQAIVSQMTPDLYNTDLNSYVQKDRFMRVDNPKLIDAITNAHLSVHDISAEINGLAPATSTPTP